MYVYSRSSILMRSVIAAILSMLVLSGCQPGTNSNGKTSTPSSGGNPAELTVISWGGDLQDAEREAFFIPFGKSKNVAVRDTPYTGEYAKIKAQVQGGSVSWDVIEVEETQVIQAGEEGLLEPIDYSVVPGDVYLPQAKNQFGVGVLVSSTALCWNKSRIPAGTPPPSSWSDLWDLKKYPGKRGLYKDPVSTLEIALLADGVSPDHLYPLDVDRALRKLSAIKKNIVWWSGGSEFQQKLLSDYTIASGWNGRVYSLTRQNKPVDMSFNQGVLTIDWWIVPRGTRHKKEAMEFLAFAAQPDGQRLLAQKMAYGPVNSSLASSLPNDLAPFIPTSKVNLSKQIWLDAHWWAANNKKVRAKWEAWLLQ